jgi:diguanylate cyclase (GGDEF)-like protein/PAS domain S-box-containing protein
MMLVSDKNGILAVNHAQHEMLGYHASEMYGMFPWDWDANFSKDEIIDMMHRGEVENLRFETLHKRKDGSVFPVEVTANSMTVDDESLFFCVARDLTKLKQQQQYIDHLARTDELTGLANRRELNRIISHHISQANKTDSCFSVVMLDIDLFKSINDKYGHSVGDLVLQEFSGYVKAMIRKSDFFARWGGEEFFIVLPDTNQANAVKISEKLFSKVEKTECAGLAITVSAGVVEYTPGESLESLLKRVDSAVYRAKNKGRNRVEVAETFF